MRGDFHVRFCERLGVRFPGATRMACGGAGDGRGSGFSCKEA